MKKEFAWSWSQLENYRSCPKKYYHVNYAKDVKDEDNQFSADGREIHQALFSRVVKGLKLPLNLRHLERIAVRFVGLPGESSGELKFAMSRGFAPESYFSPRVYVRVVVDLLNVQDTTALIVDWKTGKVKPGFGQLELTAAVLASHLPEIEIFKLAYVWLNEPTISSKTIRRGDIAGVWNTLLPEVSKIEQAIQSVTFPPKKSGLCAYCPVLSCPMNTNERLRNG